MVKLTKRYRAAQESADLGKEYTVEEAVDVLGKMPKAKFDETVEISMKLLVDPRKGDEMVRGTVMLPHGSGKTVKVLAFTSDPEAASRRRRSGPRGYHREDPRWLAGLRCRGRYSRRDEGSS